MPLAPHQLPWTGTGLIRVDSDGVVKIFDPSTGLAAASFDSAAGVASGSGDNNNQDRGSGVNTAGVAFQGLLGTAAAPDTQTNPVIKASRTFNLLATQVNGAGQEQGCAIEGVTFSTAANQVQTVGVLGAANNSGTAAGATGNPDALGTQGKGVINSAGAIGRGIGLVGTGQTNQPTAAGVDGAQLFCRNDSGVDGVVSSGGQSKYRGLSIYSLGGNLGSAGIELVGPSSTVGQQFDVGLHFGGQNAGPSRIDAAAATVAGSAVVTDAACVAADFNKTVTGAGIPTNTVITAVTPGVSFTMSAAATQTNNPLAITLSAQGPAFTAAIQDDSDAQYGLLITANANHQKAAIQVIAGAGQMAFGNVPAASVYFLIKSDVDTHLGLQVRRHSATQAVDTFSVADETGVAMVKVANNGDLALAEGKNIQAGTVTGTIIGTTALQKLGFFAKAPVVQPSAPGAAAGYVAGATVATFHSDDTYTGNTGATAYTVNGLVAALKGLGLIAA